MLAEVWPTTSARLTRLLRALRVPPHIGEEIVQEVAVRALTSGVECVAAADLWPWASTVARRLAVDHWRSMARVASAEVPDLVGRDSVEEVVESRLRFEATIKAIRGLSHTDQDHLIGLTHESPGYGPLPSRVKVAVHRARRRLLVALGEVGAVLGGWRIGFRLRRLPSAATLAVVAFVPIALLLATRAPRGVAGGWPGPARPASNNPDPPASFVTDQVHPRPAAPPGAGHARGTGGAAGRPAALRAAALETTIPIRYPANLPPGKITVRAKQPGDHLVCVNKVPVLAQACVG